MTDPMHDRCPALEPGTGERCVLYAKHISDNTGVHVATGSWPVEAEGTDEELRALVTDAISVGDVARRYARIYDRDPMTVLAAVEATLYVLDDRKPAADEVSTPLNSPPREPLDDCPNAEPHGAHFAILDQQALIVQWCPGIRPPREDVVVLDPSLKTLLDRFTAAPAGEVVSDGADPDMMAAQSWDAHERAGEVVSVPPPAPAADCVYDAWGADFGVQAGAQCINSDPVHQGAHHADPPAPVSPPVDAPGFDPALIVAAQAWVIDRYPYEASAYVSAEARHAHIAWDARTTAGEAEARHFWAAGVAEGRRQATEERTEEKVERIREWLRMHGDYDVELSLWASYGTIRVALKHLTKTVWTDQGTTYGKRLDGVLAQIEKLGEVRG